MRVLALAGCLLCGCARGEALLFVEDDASATSRQDAGGRDAGSDAASEPGLDAGCTPGAAECPEPDPEPDAAVGEPDAGPRFETQRATFRVMQAHGALQGPLVTDLVLKIGDQLRITASGKIWPGLAAQGCNGPDGTAGMHSGSGWALQGGPDFALVAFLNGGWQLVGATRELRATAPGALQLGINDDDPGTGDDCTSADPSEQGFSVMVELKRPVL